MTIFTIINAAFVSIRVFFQKPYNIIPTPNFWTVVYVDMVTVVMKREITWFYSDLVVDCIEV